MATSFLLTHPSGRVLRAEAGQVALADRADDHALWRLSNERFESLVGGVRFDAPFSGTNELGQPSFAIEADAGLAATYAAQLGPTRLPSEHLAEMRDQGYTVLDNVLEQPAIERLKKAAAVNRAKRFSEEPPYDGFFWMRDGLVWSADLCRGSTHPVALWLLQRYLSTDNIHFCHQPVITTAKPAKELLGTFPDGGWHADYPYHPGVFPNDDWPVEPVFGAQFNICVDAFTAPTAATQFRPGSHTLLKVPPEAYNLGGTRMGEGQHEDVAQLIAPAGAALLYDARTWHRACYELNVSGADRIAILNAVSPDWVLPMTDKTWMFPRWDAAPAREALTERERADVESLCINDTAPTPAGMPSLQERPGGVYAMRKSDASSP